ncbi:hypothetical protein [Spiroplasma ixodetis]|uniref:hypothetical protein n=1 Tax=Spiroplasma ixodetis TaxID=2141 RepID=UPI0024933166|nr:hypothetical protein [Spiroplasma ixodetis]
MWGEVRKIIINIIILKYDLKIFKWNLQKSRGFLIICVSLFYKVTRLFNNLCIFVLQSY